MKGEKIAPKRPSMEILKSHSLEEAFVTFINFYVQTCDFSVLNFMIVLPLDRVHVTAVSTCTSTNAFSPGPESSPRRLLGSLLGLAGGVKVRESYLQSLAHRLFSFTDLVECQYVSHMHFV